jgi:hypothetical protein
MVLLHCCCGLYWHRPGVQRYYVWYNLVPLIKSHVEATLIDQMVQVDISQQYVNNESCMIEASYIFPLDERAAVCGFEAEIAGKRIVGTAKEKQQAKRCVNEFPTHTEWHPFSFELIIGILENITLLSLVEMEHIC